MLKLKEPAYFVDTSTSSDELENIGNKRLSHDGDDDFDENYDPNESFVFIKSVNENENFKLKCHARGRPRPTVSWLLLYQNKTSFRKSFRICLRF